MKNFAICTITVFSLLLFSCNSNNITTDNSLKKYFDENNVTGCFAVFDNSHGDFIVNNLNRYRDSVFLPAQTFDVILAMAGIQDGVIENETSTLRVDSSHLPFLSGAATSLKEAFLNNNNAYFQEVAKRIGKDTLQQWVDSLGYGSRYEKATIKKVDSFWLDNSVKITPDEQLGLAKKIYFNQLPFQDRPSSIVKSLLDQENTANYRMAYYTGYGRNEKGNTIGWIAGWIEENMHIYPFVLNTEAIGEKDLSKIQVNMLKAIMTQLGFFQGNK